MIRHKLSSFRQLTRTIFWVFQRCFCLSSGDDPFALNVTQVATFTSSVYPYQGRYPCGSLFYKGTWWYGTYYLDNPNSTVGDNYVGPNPGPNCGNWCIQGPVVDFRHSTDKGLTWHEVCLSIHSRQ